MTDRRYEGEEELKTWFQPTEMEENNDTSEQKMTNLSPGVVIRERVLGVSLQGWNAKQIHTRSFRTFQFRQICGKSSLNETWEVLMLQVASMARSY